MKDNELDEKIKKLTEHEETFLSETKCEKNEHDCYVYISQNGYERIALDLFLLEYKQWLIENKIVKLI